MLLNIVSWPLKKRLVLMSAVTVLALIIEIYYRNDIDIKVNGHFVRSFILFALCILSAVALFVKVEPILKSTLMVVIAMTGFGFVMVPIYNVFCDVTGLNGKMDLSLASAVPDGVDSTREVIVEFDVNYNQNMVWKFKPQHTSVKIHPGQLASTGYFATNPSKRTMVAQAIPSISPSKASKYFKKVECFCFSSQKLGAGETANLGLRFYLDKNLPADVHRITLSYTLFDVTDQPNLHRLKHTTS